MPLAKYQTYDINEKQLENLIVSHPEIIDDNITIIGQQVVIKETTDRIDILAINNAGEIIIIDTKYNNINTQNDFQLLKYISFVSYWKPEDIIEYMHFSKFNLSNMNIPPIEKINRHQKIIIIANTLNNKVNNVFSWLRSKNIDVIVLKINLFRNDEDILINIENIIPGLKEKYIYTQSKPLIDTTYTKELHLISVTESNLELIETFNEIITTEYDVIGPDWSRTTYVLFVKNGNNFLHYRVNKSSIKVHVYHDFKKIFNKDLILDKLSKKLSRKIINTDISFG